MDGNQFGGGKRKQNCAIHLMASILWSKGNVRKGGGISVFGEDRPGPR